MIGTAIRVRPISQFYTSATLSVPGAPGNPDDRGSNTRAIREQPLSHIARRTYRWDVSSVERDLERGRAVAAELKALGVKKRELIRAAEQGYITELECKMPECFCPEELGGASYFAQVTNDWSDWRSDWIPTLEHFPVYKKDGGKAAVDNAILAHRFCNRLDHSLRTGRSHRRDLERIRKAREEGIRRNSVLTGNTEGGEIATVDAIVEPVEETDPEAEAATLTKNAPEWKCLPDAEKARYLLDHQTISDRTWTDERRLKGEKRDAFIHRVLGSRETP